MPRHQLYPALSLARAWATLATAEIHSKATGAQWALPRLPPEHRPALERSLAVYRGEASDDALVAYAEHVADEIDRDR